VDLFSYFHGPFFLHAPSGPLFLVDSFPSGRYFLGRFFSNCGRFSVDLFSVDLFFRTPNNVLVVLQISSESVHFRRSYSQRVNTAKLPRRVGA